MPIPSDPFALPFSDDSDPLRGPIFIPLDLSCLIDTSVQSMDGKFELFYYHKEFFKCKHIFLSKYTCCAQKYYCPNNRVASEPGICGNLEKSGNFVVLEKCQGKVREF